VDKPSNGGTAFGGPDVVGLAVDLGGLGGSARGGTGGGFTGRVTLTEDGFCFTGALIGFAEGGAGGLVLLDSTGGARDCTTGLGSVPHSGSGGAGSETLGFLDFASLAPNGASPALRFRFLLSLRPSDAMIWVRISVADATVAKISINSITSQGTTY
jgi:hypothetical protein